MMSSMAKFSHEDKYDENGRNKSRICCQFCSSVILSSSAGTFLTHEFDLPHMRSKRDEGEEEKVEKLKDYWLVEDMYTFENMHALSVMLVNTRKLRWKREVRAFVMEFFRCEIPLKGILFAGGDV
ncbi:guanine nucleotide exchange factor MSS4 homolog isoform X3 [Diachasmimorpha longicaudata]|uniref:guanine nucleotide exchange factor MSS4 homolog isoform X3 n=1 Tax=Diachasmimorpha longicaudata TaxID=58733 RepID=UPI0030B8B0DD